MSDPIDKEVFTDIANGLVADDHSLTLLDIVESVPDLYTDRKHYFNADFAWGQRMIRLRLEDGRWTVNEKEIDLANPNSLDIMKDIIKEFKKNPRMLPFHVSKPAPNNMDIFAIKKIMEQLSPKEQKEFIEALDDTKVQEVLGKWRFLEIGN